MAHELSIRANGKAEMAFIGGETPWHGLGQPVTKGASIGVWAKEAGMDWDAMEAEVRFRAKGAKEVSRPVMSHKVIYRSDTKAPLGVVGERYNVVQPKQVLEFFRDMTEQGGWYIHTAGVLRGGRKVWAMATNGQIEKLGKKGKSDQIINQLLFGTSLDGSMKTVVKECATVVVCANTLAVALGERKKGVVISHRSVFDERAVKRALGLAQGSFDSFLSKAREMADTPIKMDEALDVLRKVFVVKPAAPKLDLNWMGDLSKLSDPMPVDDDEKEARSVGRVLELFDGAGLGATLAGRKGTNWGLFNAVTQFVDHEMGRTPDTRLDAAWFGRGDEFKQSAYNLLAEDGAVV